MSKLFKLYLVKLWVRLSIFAVIFFSYIFYRERLVSLFVLPIYKNIGVYHVIWLFFMSMMILHLVPARKYITMAIRKTDKKLFDTIKDDIFNTLNDAKKIKFLKHITEQDKRALIVLVVWLVPNLVFGVLYWMHIIDEAFLFLLTAFYFVGDYICILFFCPFQTFIMKSKCCVNCRIFDWGHFMMFTPMVFIPSFFSQSLFIMSVIVLLRWEFVYRIRPVMFFQHTNSNLECKNCSDELCYIKNKKYKMNKK